MGNINQLFGTDFALGKLILPLGISFYTFQSMGYLIDVYRGKYAPDHNLFRFALFVSFFRKSFRGQSGVMTVWHPSCSARGNSAWNVLNGACS